MTLFHTLLQSSRFGRWSRLLTALAMIASMLSVVRPAYAAGLSVTTTTDTLDAGAGNCAAITIASLPGPDGVTSLREAICAANNTAGTDTISVPAGTYTLTRTGADDLNNTGDLDVSSSMAIDGAGAGSTIIDGNGTDRIFDVFPSSPITFDLSDVTVRNGRTPTTGFTAAGGIYLNNNVTATISNSTFSGNTATTSGGAIEDRGPLTVTNSTFTNNTSGALGGAINASSTTAILNVTGSTFTGNQAESGGALNIATNSGNNSSITTSLFQNNRTVVIAGGAAENGGAINIDTDGNVTITKSTFTGNTADVNGGAIYFNDNATQGSAPTLTANFNRIVGNTASGSGGGLYRASGTASAENNWWGCNAGPGNAGCDSVSGTADFDPRLNLTLTANPTTVNGGGTSALEASFLTNSANAAVSASNLTALVGVPITFGATLGTISGAQTTIQSNGTATATFTAGSTPGAGSARATVDNQQVSANITINNASTTTTITSDNPDPSVVGQAVTINYTVTASSGTPTGNVTVSDGTQSCTGTVAAGQCSITFTSAGAKSLTATYAGGTGFSGSTSAAEPHTVNKADTTTAITSDTPDPSVGGQAVTVQYSVTANAPGAGTPTGNVTVSDGVDSCTATVASGQCLITLTTTGSRTLTATYPGDSNFNGSTSAAEPHSVISPATTTTITSDTPDPSVVGQSVTINYTVTATGGTPTGNVTVSDGTQSCTGTVAAGQCSITFTSAGAKSLTATYAGDGTFTTSTSAAEPHTVNKADTTTTITSDTPDPSGPGQAVTVQYSVAVNAPGAGTPTGNVTVSDGVDSCTATVASGQCLITLTTAGARTLAATYPGDSNFNGSTSADESHTVDATAPVVTSIVRADASPTNAATVHFTVTFSKSVSGVDATDFALTTTGVSGASVTGVSGSGDTRTVTVSTGSGDGTIRLDVTDDDTIVDGVGNPLGGAGAGNGSFTTGGVYAIDKTAPDTTISTFPLNPSNSSSATFGFSGSDNQTPAGSLTFECKLDGGSFAACTSPQSYSNLADGSHTFQVRAKDAAGNVDPTPASYTWTIDATAPDTTITSQPLNPTNSTGAGFTFTGSDGGTGLAGFECKLDGGSFAACTSPQSYSGLADGSHTFQVRAKDAAGNADPTPASYTWVVDTTPPDTAIIAYPINPSSSAGAHFGLSGNDGTGSGVAGFECKLDGGSFTACTSPQDYSNLADGSHTFQVRAIDSVGNVDPTPASYTWTIDTIAPSVTINQASGQADPTTSSPINFTAVFGEPVNDFTSADVTLGGTAAGTLSATVTGGPTTYNVAVSGMTGDGTVIASIPANTAADAAGNRNTASTSTDNSVTFIANQAPVAVDDTATVNEDSSVNVNVVANDSDPDGNTVFVSGITQPSNGTTTNPGNGIVRYVPNANYFGPDSFTYTISDGRGGTATATVNVTVNPVNDAPSFTKGPNVSVAEDSGAYSQPWATAISKGPANESGQTLTFQVTNNNNTGLFSAQPAIAANGTLTFTPASNANGSATVTVKLKDSGGTANGGVDSSASQTFTITVTPVNDAPTVTVVRGDTCTGDFSGRMLLSLSDVDSSAGGLTLTGSSSSTSVVPNGNITFGGSGANRTVSITAVSGSSVRNATVTIKVSDGSTNSTATIKVVVGTNKNDSIEGSSGADMIFAGNGGDTIKAGAGNDLVCGGNGDNDLHGGDGNDVIEAGNGNDKLYGEDNNDILRGGNGNDTLTGGDDADFFSGGSGTDTATDFRPSQGDTKDNTIP